MKKKLLTLSLATFLMCGSFAVAKFATFEKFENPFVAEAATDLETYYQNVNGNGAGLLSTIKSAVSSGFDSIGYKGLYNAYKSTDTRPDGSLRDLYSDKTTYHHGSKQCGNYSQIGDCYNREHAIPQSWWGGGTGNQGCDIYIVWPSDGKINGARSNFPFGETGGVGTRYALDGDPEGNILGNSNNTAYVSGTVFEPFDDRKGDMARTYFYAMARWNAASWTSDKGNKVFSSSGNNGFIQGYLNMLLKWHTQDPVSEFEINRNNGGQKEQGNRNPFVDHPSWVDLIWGGTYVGTNAENTSSGSVVNGKLDGDVPVTPTLSSILIENQTTTYFVGDTFTFDGKCTAQFSNGSSKTVTPTIKTSPNMSVAGETKVVFSYTEGGVTKEFELTIYVDEKPQAEPVGLSLTNIKTEYTVGDTFVKPQVELLFDDGTSIDISDSASFSEVDLSQPATQLMVIVSYTYGDDIFSDSYYIDVAKTPEPAPTPTPEPVRIEIVSVKTEYEIGEEFAPPRVILFMDDGSETDVSSRVTCSPVNLSEPCESQTVTVTYDYYDEKFTATYTIRVLGELPPTLVEISLNIYQTEFEVGDEFVKPTVTAYFDDGTSKDVTDKAFFSGFDMSIAGSYTVTVSYFEEEAFYVINVNEHVDPPGPVVVKPVSMELTNLTTAFAKGDAFVKPTVIVTYEDETTKDVTEQTVFSGYDMDKLGSQFVTVTFIEGEVTLTSNYAIVVRDGSYNPGGETAGGCRGNIEATSIVLSTLSLVGISLILIRRNKAKKED